MSAYKVILAFVCLFVSLPKNINNELFCATCVISVYISPLVGGAVGILQQVCLEGAESGSEVSIAYEPEVTEHVTVTESGRAGRARS